MDATLKKLLNYLDPSTPDDLRLAAAVLVPELAPDEDQAHERLAQALEDAHAGIRRRAIQAAGRLKIQEALPRLVTLIESGGEEGSDAAAAAARLGARGAKALQDMMPKVAPGLRRVIASALGAAGTASGEAAAVEFLLDKDPGVIASAVKSLIAQVPTLSAAKKHTLAEQLIDHLEDAKSGLPPASRAAAIRLLAALHDERGEPIFWDHIVPPYAADIRNTALQALGGLQVAPNKEHLKRLFACARETDFRIAVPAVMLLQHQAVSKTTLPDWLGLFEASDVAARRLALEKLSDTDSAQVADALITQIHHPDRAYRDAVLARLAAMPAGQKALETALLDAETPDAAWTVARGMAPFAKDFSRDRLDKVFARAAKDLEANDRRADPLFFLLREADAAGLQERLAEKAAALRKKKNYEGAMTYLRLLARDPSIAFDLRFELAAVGLKVSSKELALRGNDPCLGQFSHLVQGYEAELGKALEKAKWLEPEDLFYLGFHFVERDGVFRKFGGSVLQLLLKRSPKSKLAKDAKTKLKASGVM